MSKKKISYNAISIDMKYFDRLHNSRLSKYSKEIKDLFDSYVLESVQLGYGRPMPSGSLFSFDKNVATKRKANELFRRLASDLEGKIKEGISIEWGYANGKHNKLVDKLLGSGKLSSEKLNRFKPTNKAALDAFLDRSSDGIKLSDKVWKITKGFKLEVENSITAGIIEGKGAKALARDIRANLLEPDNIIRRVRNKKGALKLSNRAKNLKTGQGVYRSSVKNAERLTRTEINISYRTADGLRWSSSEFVRGIRVELSPQHPRFDICDTLKGLYPKNFKFTGWHPQCICTAVAELISEKELEALELAELNGVPYKTANNITEIPKGMNDWLDNNKDRAKGWKNMPYFVRDNFKGGKITGSFKGGF